MRVQIEISARPLEPRGGCPPELAGDAGAIVEFRGNVRGEEDGQVIAALDYEAYSPMAERVMRQILDDIATRQPCLFVRVAHRIGVVPVGETVLHIVAGARHRAQALALVTEFMDRLKRDVPIWKCRALNPPAATPAELEAAASSPSRPAGLDEIVRLVRESCRPLAVEAVALADALGRVLREPVRAPEDLPAFDRSAVDGYAVRRDDARARFVVVDSIRAGDWKPRELQPGQAVRIATGGAIPSEGLEVIMQEDVRVGEGRIEILNRNPERHLRRRGEDARRGQMLVSPGTRVSPGALALLASVGCARPRVTRLPRVLHLATGNELVAPDTAPGPGQIRDSNSALVRAFLAQWRIAVQQIQLPEDEALAKSLLRTAGPEIEAVDVLLISGGASVGEHDATRNLLEHLGYAIRIQKTNLRPGKPLIVATRGPTLAFGLPGNPLAHFVCLNLIVRAALERLAGVNDATDWRTARLAVDFDADGNARETFWPGRLHFGSRGLELGPLPWSSSGDLTSLATANALARIPPGCRHLPGGAEVAVFPTGAMA